MRKKLALTFLLSFCTFAENRTPETVLAADGHQYRLVKAEKKLSNGATAIAEFVRVGDTSEGRYAMRLARTGEKPAFWKLSN